MKSGEERIIAWNNTVIRSETGTVIGTFSSGEEITVRKVTEAGREKLIKSKLPQQIYSDMRTLQEDQGFGGAVEAGRRICELAF